MKTLGLHFAVLFGISLALAAGGGAASNDLHLDKASAAFRLAVNSGRLTETGFNTFENPAFVTDHFNVRLGRQGRKIVNTPFQVTITAKDSSGRTVRGYSGENTLNLNSDSHATIAPAAVTLTNGVWQGEVTISAAEYGIVIWTSGADKEGKSAAFDVLYPGPYSQIRGRVRYNGNPFLTSSHVEFSLFDEIAGRLYPVPPSCFNPANGRFSIPYVRRGTYAIFLKTDSDTPPSFEPFPGDFWGGSGQFTVVAPGPTIRNFAVCRLIHLTSPVNNDPPGIPAPPPYPSHPSPVTFAWDPVPEAVTYEIEIVKALDDSNQAIGVVLREPGLTATSKAAILPANEPGQHYAFRVVAVNHANERVGDFYVTMTNPSGGIYGFRADYLFKIIASTALDHFDISFSIEGTKVVNTPFPITITAKDSSENTVTGYSGENTLELNFYPHTNITPSTVTLTNGVWQGEVTISAAEYGVVIWTSEPDKQGKSAAFDVLYPGPYSIVSGQVQYNGNPFLTSSHVDFSLFDETAGRRYPVPPSCYNSANGRFSIPNVRRGAYAIFLKTDSDTPPNFNPFPGDFWGGSEQFTVAAPNPTIRNFAVCRLIHLTSPANNDPPGIPVPPPYPSYPSPVPFAWDPVPEAATYEIEIYQVSDDSSLEERENAYRESDMTVTSKIVSLPANAPNHHYEFRVVALNHAGENVGDSYVTLTNPSGGIWGFGGYYIFKVL